MNYRGLKDLVVFGLAIAVMAMVLSLFAGCTTVQNWWDNDGQPGVDAAIEQLDAWWATVDAQNTPDTQTDSGAPEPPVVVPAPPLPIVEPNYEDAIEFSKLKWKYGGFNGSSAKLSTPRISNLKFYGTKKLTLKWDVGLSSWGLSHGNPGAVACLFVTKGSADPKGGKFDWISTSRAERDFKNIKDYMGWSWSAVPNPCVAYLVIVSRDRKKRSNIITAKWSR